VPVRAPERVRRVSRSTNTPERRASLRRRDVGVAVLGEGEAEVDDAHAAVAVDEHVVGLEVAVDEAVLVGGGEALAGLAEHGEDLAPARVAERAARRTSETPWTNSMAMKTWSSWVPTS
jgi:hypothetical protein